MGRSCLANLGSKRLELIRGLHNVRPKHHSCVLAIGGFDGIHRGHQMIIEQLAGLGHEYNLPSVLMTFEPQPREYFNPQNAPARLTRLREKLAALQSTIVDRVLCVHFNQRLSSVPAEDFIKDVLLTNDFCPMRG